MMKKYLAVFFLFILYAIKTFSQNTIQQQTVQNDFVNFLNAESAPTYTGSYLTTFSYKDATVGSRYLFNKWVSGKVFITDTNSINTEGFVFNYDKISKKLLATKDGQKIIEVNGSAIQSFSLATVEEVLDFEKVPLLSDREFFVRLVKDSAKYSLYKSIKTKFQKADYRTNGIIESGNNYDSFTDHYEYFIVFPMGKEYKKVELKRKSIKIALSDEGKKIKQFFSKDEEGIINENFLIRLIDFLNQ